MRDSRTQVRSRLRSLLSQDGAECDSFLREFLRSPGEGGTAEAGLALPLTLMLTQKHWER